MTVQRTFLYKLPNGLNVYQYEPKPRKPIKRSPLKRSQKPIPKETKKRAKQNRIYRKSAPAFFEENPDCMIRQKGCTGKATQRHHPAGRFGERLNGKKNQLPTCDNCHKWELANPEKAKELGITKTR